MRAATLNAAAAPQLYAASLPPVMATGKPGRPATGIDPRARRPAVAARSGCKNGPSRPFVAIAPARDVSNACEGVMPGLVSGICGRAPSERSPPADRSVRGSHRGEYSRLGLGLRRAARQCGALRFGLPRLHVRPAPCPRRRSYRGDRQFDPQADAAGPATGRRRALFLARPFDGRRGAVGRRRLRLSRTKFTLRRPRPIGSLWAQLAPRRHFSSWARDCQPRRARLGLAHIPGGQARRAVLRRRFRYSAQQPRASGAGLPAALPDRDEELAPVPDRLPVRPRIPTPPRRSRCSAFRRPKPPTAPHSARCWCSRRSSPPA